MGHMDHMTGAPRCLFHKTVEQLRIENWRIEELRRTPIGQFWISANGRAPQFLNSQFSTTQQFYETGPAGQSATRIISTIVIRKFLPPALKTFKIFAPGGNNRRNFHLWWTIIVNIRTDCYWPVTNKIWIYISRKKTKNKFMVWIFSLYPGTYGDDYTNKNLIGTC